MSRKAVNQDLLARLVKGRFISSASRRMVERYVERWQVSPFHAILQTDVLPEPALADAMAEIYKVDRVFQVATLPVSREALRVVGFKRARTWHCLAVGDFEGRTGRFEIVLADPSQRGWIDQLKQELKRELTLAVGELSDIVKAIDELYPLAEQLPSFFDVIDSNEASS
jgi:hypothetical protein